MAYCGTLSPPIDDTVEEENVTFDFGPDMVAGATITNLVEEISCTAATNATLDPNPQSRIISVSPAIVASPSTGQPAQAVVVLVGNMVATVKYLLQCVVKTSDGQQLSNWGYLPCSQPE